MNKVMSLHDAVAKYVENGDTLAIGGFTTNRKPYATVSEILRQGQKDFIVYAGPGGGEVDMLIGEGRVAAYINCYTANSGYTNVSRRFRAAIEQGKLTYEDYSQDVLMLMLHASSLGLPFLPVRLMQGSGLMKFWGISEEKRKTMPKIENLKCAEIENPMVPGQKVVAVPVPKIDTAIIHVQQARAAGDGVSQLPEVDRQQGAEKGEGPRPVRHSVEDLQGDPALVVEEADQPSVVLPVHCPLEDGGVHRLGQDSRKAVDRRVLLPLESGVEDAGVVQPVPVRGTFGRLGHGGASFPL